MKKQVNSTLKYLVLIFVFVISARAFGQIHEGKIFFERKTNLEKKYKSDWIKETIKKHGKYKTDKFILYFNDTTSVFIGDENTENDPLSWMTSQNSVIQDFTAQESRIIYNFFGSTVLLKDSIQERTWKLTDKYRTICNVECTEAVFEYDDSTRIYAWFTSAITPKIGPESYCNLPGAILGLAIEDGSITYFATAIEETKLDMELYTPRFNNKKAKSKKELIEQANKDYKMNKEELNSFLRSILMW